MTAALVFLHRWLGIALCLFFAMWFASGVVLMYVPFPSLPEQDRLAFLDPIPADQIVVSPSAALELCGGGAVLSFRMISRAGAPVYVCHTEDRGLRVIRADAPAATDALTVGQAVSIAGLHAPGTPAVVGPIQYDQWIVHQKYDAYRPLFLLDLDDAAGTHVYLSARTGEIVQRTTRHARFWNYPGAIVHWIYPTLLRKNWVWWDQTVWWLSLAGVVCAAAGVWLGVSRTIRELKSSPRRLSSFRGWLRWHHLLGLVAGVFTLSWIFSGWLSMDHGRLFSPPSASAAQVQSFRGLSFAQIVRHFTVADLQALAGAREIEFRALGGSAFLLAKGEAGLLNGQAATADEIARAIGKGWPGVPIIRQGTLRPGDGYTNLREGRLREGTVRVELADAASTWVHVDPVSGEILSVMDFSRRVYRWLFNGLHSFDVPGLVDKRPLWDGIMLVLLGLGFAGSITGAVIAFRRLRKWVSPV